MTAIEAQSQLKTLFSVTQYEPVLIEDELGKQALILSLTGEPLEILNRFNCALAAHRARETNNA
jgi:hypothetical protein